MSFLHLPNPEINHFDPAQINVTQALSVHVIFNLSVSRGLLSFSFVVSL